MAIRSATRRSQRAPDEPRAQGRGVAEAVSLAPDTFTYAVTKDGRIRISHEGRVVTTVAGQAAARLRERLERRKRSRRNSCSPEPPATSSEATSGDSLRGMSSPSKAVLITGCSTGIGAETARHLATKGWTVYATARKPETLADLAEAGCKTLALDVTDEASMSAAVDQVVEAEGAVGVLINNAGLQPVGRDRVDRARLHPPPVRDQRLRPHPHEPALPSGHARTGLGADREHRLDGRQAHLPRRRHLPRHQVLGRGDLGRDALRDSRLRRERGPDRAGPDRHRVRRMRRSPLSTKASPTTAHMASSTTTSAR